MMKNIVRKFMSDESGATMVEYAVLVALISVAAIAIIFVVGGQVKEAFEDVRDCLNAPTATCGS